MASIQATQSGFISQSGESMPAIQGVTNDGDINRIPRRGSSKVTRSDFWHDNEFNFYSFRPMPKLRMSLPHIRMDKALEYLIEIAQMKDSHNVENTAYLYPSLKEKPEIGEDELTSQRQFDDKDTFVVAKATSEDVGDHIEKTIEQVIRPPRKRRFLLRGLLGFYRVTRLAIG